MLPSKQSSKKRLAGKYIIPQRRQNHYVDLRGPRQIVPPRIRVVLPYVEVFNRGPGTFFDDYVFNLNSLFDPNRTGTGHQPLGFDQWAGFYGRYRVLSSKVRATYVNTGVAPIRCAITATNDSTALSIISFEEQPYAARGNCAGSGGIDLLVLDKTFSPAQVSGRLTTEYGSSSETQATTIASPSEVIVLHSCVASYSGVSVTYTLLVRIEYDVEFFDTLELTES